MSKLVTSIGAAIVSLTLVASPTFAHGGGGHGGGFHGGGFHGGFHDGFHGGFRDGFHRDFRGGIFFGGGFYDPYSDGYAYPYAAAPPAVWYFCPPANAYYPAAPSCPVPWQTVPAQ